MMRLVDRVLDHRWVVLAGILAVTLAALASLSRAEIGSSLGELFFGDSPDYLDYIERSKVFSSDELIVIGLEDVDVLAPETLTRIETLVDGIWALAGGGEVGAEEPEDDFDFEDDESASTPTSMVAVPGAPKVRYIASVLNAQELIAADGALKIHDYVEEARARPKERAALLEKLLADERLGGLIVSKDGRNAAIVIELLPESSRRGEADAVFVDRVVALVHEVGFRAEQIHQAGLPAIMVEVLKLSEKNLTRLTPFTTLLMLLVVFLLFRQVLPATIGFFVCGLGVIWTMGLSVMINPMISIMHSIAPVVILIVGTSDVIHLYSAYLIELDQGRPKRDAIVHACGDVGTACLYTSITTLIGFVGMSFVPTPVFRQLGITLGAGVAFTLLIAIFLVPVLQSFLPQPRAWRVGATSTVQTAIDKVFGWMVQFTDRRAVGIVIGFVILSGVSIWGVSQIVIETRMVERLDDDNPIAQDGRWFKEAFTSANILQLHVETRVPGGLNEPQVVAGMERLATTLEAHPLVDRVDSVVELHEQVHGLLRPEGDTSSLPTTREGFAQYTLLYEMGGGEGLERLVDFERRKALMAVRLHSEAVREAYDLGRSTAESGPEYFGDSATVTPTGALYLVGGWLGNVLAGQQRGLLFTFILLTLMMCIGVRSLRAGLWSMLPNVLPLFVIGGVIGWMQDETDSDTLILAMLAIGIGVDDTIHFLMRYRIEASREGEGTESSRRIEALRRTFDFAGRGIVMTTIVLTVGFLPLAFTDYYTTRIMGTLLPLTLVVALVADLLLVPALARLGVFRFVRQRVSTNAP